jgi:formylglycine-generating enzyme required for sulfatase activity
VPITNKGRYNDSKYANHPVVNVDWDQATAYCEWRGGGLPTEAQWEKAARGTDERSYPWGEGLDCNKANYYDSTKNALCVGDTTEVGSYESGKSPYGIYDLAGNVSEFVADWYSDYQTSPSSNPQGPDSGKYNNKVRRGGSLIDADVGAATRSSGSSYYHETGFRCAKDTNP